MHWIFGKHPPRPPDPDRTCEAAWLPMWQAQLVLHELWESDIPAVMSEDFTIWIQPRGNLGQFATPVALQRAGANAWRGTVAPLDDRLSLYLLILSFTNQETKRDRVVVFFDDKGKVSHVGASFDAKDVSFRMPTSD